MDAPLEWTDAETRQHGATGTEPDQLALLG